MVNLLDLLVWWAGLLVSLVGLLVGLVSSFGWVGVPEGPQSGGGPVGW
jgi:hypothetical protein